MNAFPAARFRGPITCWLFLLSLAGALPSEAQTLPAYPITDPGPSAVAWYTDRFPPSVFNNSGSLFARNNVLTLGLAASDGQLNRAPIFSSAFYNTQGRVILAGAPTAGASWIGSLYIPASWATPSLIDGSGSRRSDLWATVHPAAGGTTCAGAGCDLFPIFGFDNALFPDSNNDIGGVPRYRVFDGNNGGWIDLAAPVAFNAWTDFCVTFTGTTFEFRIGNALVYTTVDLTQADISFGPVTNVYDVAVKSYNYGYSYDSNWSNLAVGPGTCAQLRALFAPPVAAAAIPVDSGVMLAAIALFVAFFGATGLRRA